MSETTVAVEMHLPEKTIATVRALALAATEQSLNDPKIAIESAYQTLRGRADYQQFLDALAREAVTFLVYRARSMLNRNTKMNAEERVQDIKN